MPTANIRRLIAIDWIASALIGQLNDRTGVLSSVSAERRRLSRPPEIRSCTGIARAPIHQPVHMGRLLTLVAVCAGAVS